MSAVPRQIILRYAVAIGIAVGVTLLKLVLIVPLVGTQQWFLLFVAAICLSSWYGGFGPGIVTAILSALSASLFFVAPFGAFSTSPGTLFQIVLFLVEGFLVVGLTANLRETRAEAQQAERAKDEALTLLDTFQVYAPVGLAFLDTNLRYLRINYAMAELDGLTPAAHIGRTIQEVQPQIKTELIESIRQVLETGKPLLDQELIVNKPTMLGMRQQYLLTSYYRMRGADGQPLGVGAVMVDVTAHRQVEKALRESEQRFRAMADTAPVMIWLTDTSIRATYFNKVWLDFTGRTLEQELGDGWRDGVHLDDLESFTQEYTTAIDARESYETEFRLRRADGEYRWLLNHGIPRYTPDGEYLGYIGSSVDITDRKQAEIGQQFLVQAGVMLTGSLDYETTLTSVARLAVPTIADWCAVDILSPDGSKLERVAVAHVDPEKVKWAYELQERYPADLNAETGVANVLRTGKTEFYPVVTESMIEGAATDAELYEIIMQIGFTSVITAPLFARGRTLGVITLVSAESKRHYTEQDVALAEQLAARAALAVDNARLYREARTERERFRVTLASIGDGVIATDQQGLVTFINSVAQGLTGWGETDALGTSLGSVFNIVNEESRQQVEDPVGRVLREGRAVGLANHTVLVSKSGAEVPIDDSGAPIPDSDGAISGVVLVFRDVSARKRIEYRQQFIAESAKRLIASLDYETTLQTITQLAVPALADWCIIHLVDDDGTARQVALYHTDPERTALREDMMRRYPPLPTDRFSHPAVIRSGEAELIEDVDEAMLQEAAANEEHLDMLRRLRYKSSICVPLKTSNVVFGSLILRTTQGGRALDRDDLALAAELATIVSLAIENARLYRKAQGE